MLSYVAQLEWTVPKNWFDCFALARERQRQWFQQMNGGSSITPPTRSSSLRKKQADVDSVPDVPPLPDHIKEAGLPNRRYSYQSSLSSLSDLNGSVRRQAIAKHIMGNPTVFHMNGSDKQLEMLHWSITNQPNTHSLVLWHIISNNPSFIIIPLSKVFSAIYTRNTDMFFFIYIHIYYLL